MLNNFLAIKPIKLYIAIALVLFVGIGVALFITTRNNQIEKDKKEAPEYITAAINNDATLISYNMHAASYDELSITNDKWLLIRGNIASIDSTSEITIPMYFILEKQNSHSYLLLFGAGDQSNTAIDKLNIPDSLKAQTKKERDATAIPDEMEGDANDN
jgi:hypothetical protein